MPEEILTAVDRAARERGESRSHFIARVLAQVVAARRDAEVTRRLNALFAQPAIAGEQRRVAAELDSAGTNWADEAW